MKIKLEKLQIDRKIKRDLPIFYNYILFNEFVDERNESADKINKIEFDQRLNCYIDLTMGDKQISKIIDFSKMK